jgi:hypothetical protein
MLAARFLRVSAPVTTKNVCALVVSRFNSDTQQQHNMLQLHAALSVDDPDCLVSERLE